MPAYRLHDAIGEDLGLNEHPAPNVEAGDVVMLAGGLSPIIDVWRLTRSALHTRRLARETLILW
jgi:hypothetical protein